MPVATSKGGSDFELIPEGLEIGVCYAVIDLGTQEETFDQKEKLMHKVYIIWELPDVESIMIDDKPMPRVIGKEYTLSLGDKANLRKDLESWRGKAFTEEQLEGFETGALIKVNCQIQIIHKKSKKGKTYANVSTIVPVPKGHKNIEPVNPTVVYDIGNTIPDDVIPDWICEKIRAAKEWEEVGESTTLSEKVEEVEPQGQESIPSEDTINEPF